MVTEYILDKVNSATEALSLDLIESIGNAVVCVFVCLCVCVCVCVCYVYKNVINGMLFIHYIFCSLIAISFDVTFIGIGY